MKVHEYFSILIFQGKCFCTIIFTTCQSAHFTWKGIFHLSISRYFLILAAYSKFKLFENYADKNPVPVTIPTVNKINCLVIRRFKFSKILRKCLLKFHEKKRSSETWWDEAEPAEIFAGDFTRFVFPLPAKQDYANSIPSWILTSISGKMLYSANTVGAQMLKIGSRSLSVVFSWGDT